ncbi:MAG: cell wall hydrolase [Caulobacteraceae bacterium]
MDVASITALCLLHGQSPTAYPLPTADFVCPIVRNLEQGELARLRPVVSRPEARDALARVAYAEAGDQGDSGLAGVVYTVLNRLVDGRWGRDVESILNAPHQFEPVMRAGGSWRGLRPVTVEQEARISTIVSLALDGRLPDLTGGARFFQNPKTVAARAAAGTVSPHLVNFGGAISTATIGAHTFYAGKDPRGSVGRRSGAVRIASHAVDLSGGRIIFLGPNRAASATADQATEAKLPAGAAGRATISDGIFVRAAVRLSEVDGH